MKKFFLTAAVAMAIALSPAFAMCTSFTFSFTTPNTNGQGASDVFAFGTLSGTSLGNGWYLASSGTIEVSGATTPVSGAGVLIPGGPGQTTSPNGYFYFDNQVNPTPGTGNPFLDNNGLLFDVGGTEVNIYSGTPTSSFMGPGTNTYTLYENGSTINYWENGEFNIAQLTPEQSSLLLLGTGLLGMAFLLRKGFKSSGTGSIV